MRQPGEAAAPAGPTALSCHRSPNTPAGVRSSGRPLEYTMLLAPRRTAVAERLLEEAGLAGDVRLRDLPLDWVPLDEDLLSLEMPLAFRVSGAHGCNVCGGW